MPYPLTDPLKPMPIIPPMGNPKPAIASPDPLQSQYQKLRTDFDAAGQRATTFRNQQAAIAIPAPIIKEGRMSVSSVASPATDAAVSARRTLGERAAAEDATRTSMIPAFQGLTTSFREQAAKNRAIATAGDANRVLSDVGATPVPKISRPDFGNVSTGFSTRQAPVARTASQLEQASRDEVVARHEVNGPGATGAAIASPTASGYFIGGDGIRKEINADGSIAGRNSPVISMSSNPAGVQTQNLGTSPIARPGSNVSPYFGLPVTDLRANDQVAPIARPQGTFRGPDQMAESYHSREDREDRQQLASEYDTAAFLARGKPNSAEVLGNLLDGKARLLSGAERLSQEAIQNRMQRDNQLGITDLNNAGETQRTRIGADVAAMQDGTERYKADVAAIARPTFITDAQDRYLRVDGGNASEVRDGSGAAIRMPPQAQSQAGAITPALRYEQGAKELQALLNNPPLGEDPAYNQQVATARANLAALAQGGRTEPPAAAVQFLKENPDLAGEFDKKFGAGAASHYLGGQPGARIAVNHQTGERLQFNSSTRKWEPVP